MLKGSSREAVLMGVVAAISSAAPAVAVPTEFLGPTPYLCIDDSPFDLTGLGTTFLLEDAEDGLINSLGLTINGNVTGPGGITDSVDCDDGSIDGLGQAGKSIFGPGNPGLTITFDQKALGAYPTAAGVVWTDGSTFNNVTFEAFDANGASLGTLVGLDIGDGNFNNGTAEDRFFGVHHAEGLSKLTIKCQPLGAGSGIEIDHVQYGASRVVRACPADLSGDGQVDGADITVVLGAWGACVGCAADLDGDGEVSGFEIATILGAWGPCR